MIFRKKNSNNNK